MTDPWAPTTPPTSSPPYGQVPLPPGPSSALRGPTPTGWTPPEPVRRRPSLTTVIVLGLLGWVALVAVIAATVLVAPSSPLLDTDAPVAAPFPPQVPPPPPVAEEPVASEDGAALPPGEDGVAKPLGRVWAASDGFWDVTYDDVEARLDVLEDGAGEDCGDVRLSAVTPASCTSWSSARLRGEEGTVEVDALLLALGSPAVAATAAATDQEDGVEADLGGLGRVLRVLVLQIGDSPYVLYATVRAVRPGDSRVLQSHATDALRATSLLATDPVVAQLFGD